MLKMIKLKRVAALVACAAVASVPALATGTVNADVQTGLDNFTVTHSAITTVAIAVLGVWMGFRFVKKIKG